MRKHAPPATASFSTLAGASKGSHGHGYNAATVIGE